MNTVERERFGGEELAVCLSHYDLGIVHSVREFARGSRKAPKLLIDCDRGKFLLKRRKGKEDVARVAFTHSIQLALAAQGFPLPHLVTTRVNNNSMLVLSGAIYELFEYIEGGVYDVSLEATYNAGRILGLYHKLLKDFRSNYQPPTGSYHNARTIHQAIRTTVSSLPLETRPSSDVINTTVVGIEEVYRKSSEKAAELGLENWACQIVHGDWHPGNMLFVDKNIVAVIDYDTARFQQRVIDLANGVLQFSIIGGGEPSQWPAHVDLSRFKRFLRGYDSVNVISVAELKAIPFLMCEAMVAEAVLPIAATGSFGRMDGFPFLQMVLRKTRWILSNIEHLTTALED